MKETDRGDGTSGGSNPGKCTGVFSGGIAAGKRVDPLPFSAENMNAWKHIPTYP